MKLSLALQGAVCSGCLITVMLWAAFSMRQWCQGRPLLGQQTGEDSCRTFVYETPLVRALEQLGTSGRRSWHRSACMA